MYHASRVTSSTRISKFRNSYFLRIFIFTSTTPARATPRTSHYARVKPPQTASQPQLQGPIASPGSMYSNFYCCPEMHHQSDQISLGSSPVCLPCPAMPRTPCTTCILPASKYIHLNESIIAIYPLPHVFPNSARLTPTPHHTAADAPSRATGLESSAPRGSRTQRRRWTSGTRRRRHLRQS
jgi:hypothetical protein